MKKLGMLLLALVLVLGIMCGCGAATAPAPAEGARNDAAMDTTDSGAYGSLAPKAAGDAVSSGIAIPAPAKGSDVRLENAKLIYTANLEMETTAFEQTDRDLATLVEQMGGYFENSSVNNYGSGYRSGSYTVRVPAAQFKPFCEQVGKLCHITFKSSSAENISESYYDTESRLTTQQTKLQRLQALLAKADKMEDIITLESAIGDTELAIEQLSGTLRQYDTLVDYATVCLTLSEVYQLSDTEEPATGFAQRLGTAFSSGWKSFTSGLEGLLVMLAYAWPWLLVLAIVVAVIVVVMIRSGRLKKKPRKGSDQGSSAPPPTQPLL